MWTSNFARIRQLPAGLEPVAISIDDLREQDINAHMMEPRMFDQLVANIKKRGSLESLPYCAQPNGVGPIEIVSGHHRVRAAKASGLKTIHVLLDRALKTRSLIVSKQLAHNALVGTDDKDVIKQLLKRIDTPDDLLATGLPQELLGQTESDAIQLFTPTIDMKWKTVSFAFLPHQLENLEKLFDSMDESQDLVVAALEEQWTVFLAAVSKVGRIKKVLAGGMIVSMLTDLALAEIAKSDEEALAKESENGKQQGRSAR